MGEALHFFSLCKQVKKLLAPNTLMMTTNGNEKRITNLPYMQPTKTKGCCHLFLSGATTVQQLPFFFTFLLCVILYVFYYYYSYFKCRVSFQCDSNSLLPERLGFYSKEF